MRLAYVAFDKSGRQVAETIDASDTADATEKLRRQGLYVTSISGGGAAGAGPVAARPRRRHGGGRGRRLKNLAMFMRQLQVLVSSGTPLVQALGALQRQAKPGPWQDTVADVRTRVEEGASLSMAMDSHGDHFDPVCRSLVAAGESSGNLGAMLERLAVITRKQLHTRSAVIGALVYPTLLLVVAVSVLTLLLLFVIPRFGALFESLDVPLPPSTRMLIQVSHLLRSYWWIGLLLVVGSVAAARLWLGSPAGKKAVDTAILRLPQAGRMARSFATARISRILGVLLDGHVPILDALELTRQSAGNCHYADLITQAQDAVARGESISSVFRDTDLISPAVYEAVHSGEQSGQVGPLLLNIADFLDQENEVVLRSLTSILEPVILVFMGLLVGLVALSMFTPLFDLTSMTHGGM